MKIEDILLERRVPGLRATLLKQMAETDDPTERARLVARYNKLFKDPESTLALAKVAQDVDQAQANRPQPGEGDVYDWEGEGGKLRIHVTKPNKPDGATLSTGQLANKEPNPISDILPGEPGSGLERVPTGTGRGDGAAEVAARAKRAKELERMQANAGLSSGGGKAAAAEPAPAPAPAPATAKPSKPEVDPLDAMYPYRAPDGRRLKYKHGDIRNAFHSSPDSRKAGSDKVIRGDRVGKRLVDKEPVSRTNQDDRAK